MRLLLICGLTTAVLASGCASRDSWRGLEAEKSYDRELDALRLAAIRNNDDYYEVHKDGRIYVLADEKDYRDFVGVGEIVKRVTKIGGGPRGETVVYAIARAEGAKATGFGAQEMYEGRLDGVDKDFFAVVATGERYFVFGTWADLKAWRAGAAPAGRDASGPQGKPVTFVGNVTPAVEQRFAALHAS